MWPDPMHVFSDVSLPMLYKAFSKVNIHSNVVLVKLKYLDFFFFLLEAQFIWV